HAGAGAGSWPAGNARARRRGWRRVAHRSRRRGRLSGRGHSAGRPGGAAVTPLRLVVADDHELVRTGFAGLLDSQPDFTVVDTAADGVEAIQLCQEQHPDVVLMDIRMPGMDG